LQIVGEQSGTVDSTDASSGGTEAPDKKAKITLTEQEEKFAKQFLQELFSKFLFLGPKSTERGKWLHGQPTQVWI
jgi:hypothetical protein